MLTLSLVSPRQRERQQSKTHLIRYNTHEWRGWVSKAYLNLV